MKVSSLHRVTASTLPINIPLLLESVACGFPLPSEGLIDKDLNLSEFLIKHPSATFFARAQGDSLEGKLISAGDTLIIDRSVKPVTGSIVIVSIDGEYMAKILDLENRLLLSANEKYAPIEIPDDLEVIVEGVVIHAIRHF